MTDSEIMETITSIFRMVLKRENIILTETTTAGEVEGWDSLTNMTLMAETERHFGIRLSFREIMKLRNIGDLCRLVSEKTGERD